jgi:hypothetical protein
MPAACRQHSFGFWFINETQTAEGVDPCNWWHGVIGPSSGSDTESGQVTFRQSFLHLSSNRYIVTDCPISLRQSQGQARGIIL